MVEDQKRKITSSPSLQGINSDDNTTDDNDPTINYPIVTVDLSKKKKRRIMTNQDIEGSRGSKMLLATTTRTTSTASNIVSDDDDMDDDDVSHDSAWDVFDNFIGRSNVNPNTVDDDPNYEEGFDFYRDLQRKIVAEDMEQMILHADSDLDSDSDDTNDNAGAATAQSNVRLQQEVEANKKKRIKASRIMDRIRSRRSINLIRKNSERSFSSRRRSSLLTSEEMKKKEEEEVREQQKQQQQQQELELQKQQLEDSNKVNNTKELRKSLVYDERTERLVYVDKDKDAKQKYAANQKKKKDVAKKTKPVKKVKAKTTKHSNDHLDHNNTQSSVSKFFRRFQRKKVVLSRASGRFA